ncbi:hypothetical protein CLOSTHATH_05812 [Hungatella hathewayi DSM 13479]|uniref:Uncharacterized protein n=1 Tax=Hungatella hathewayi DSM 13479 TaxID=566550 RepID=D3AQA6_9FIRM|nr:hypothetical protein CLOSTHATH_05812 [Hungatella hathewayi DSM 13479]
MRLYLTQTKDPDFHVPRNSPAARKNESGPGSDLKCAGTKYHPNHEV